MSDTAAPAVAARMKDMRPDLILAEVPGRLAELDPDHDLYVVCHSSGRSMRVLQYLAQVGYDGICVRGGMLAWQEHGKPVEIGDPRPEGDAGR